MKRVLMLCLLLSFGACKSKSNDAPKPAPAPTPSAAVAPRAQPERVSLASIPTPEDFEEEAEKQITPDNLEAELDKLEQELKAP